MEEAIGTDARKVLSAHGHAFQYAVLRHAQTLANEGRSSWVFEAAEFPVGPAQTPIHVDFILRARRKRIYLVAECKRADPAKARWCFVRAPYTRREGYERELVFQEVRYDAISGGKPFSRVKNASIDACHLGVELRAQASGDGLTSGSAIKDATAQVLRATNGLVDHFFLRPGLSEDTEGFAIFLPVIFTTATLWVASGDLGTADLATGQLPNDWGEVKRVKWLWYTYNQSPALRHGLKPTEASSGFDLSDVLHREFARTIAIVGADGIDPFLQADLELWI